MSRIVSKSGLVIETKSARKCGVLVSNAKRQVIETGKIGSQGPPGVGLETLLPRIEKLESDTDGLVSGSDPLAYYILAKN